jgi:hypothetical protein
MGFENVRVAHDPPPWLRATVSTVFAVVFNVNT